MSRTSRHLMVALGMALATGAPLALAEPPALPDGPGKAVVERTCARCHSLETVTRLRRTRRQWEAELDLMITRGAILSDDDFDSVATYLATHFGSTGGP